MRYTVRPISDRSWFRPTAVRQGSRFDATWTRTLHDLGREVELLDGCDMVIECDVLERHLRNDGQIRADAEPSSPAVVVAFESKHGPMLYRSDRYGDYWSNRPGWQDNVRAVALTLEALRAVARWGAVDTGQQYAGFKALPAGTAMPASHMTSDDARLIIGRAAGFDDRTMPLAVSDGTLRRARGAAHPDRNAGDRTAWDQVEQAAKVLGLL